MTTAVRDDLPNVGTRFKTIALAGNPNCGKTTVFNALTGLRHKVANYPGVTVEKKEGRTRFEKSGEVAVVDLPGIYSLWGHSIDETIASHALVGELGPAELPDLIISLVDASNLERNLYLTTQLLDLGIPLVVALNMMDLAEKKGVSVRKELLSRALGVPVIGLSAAKGMGIEELKHTVDNCLLQHNTTAAALVWLPKEHPRYHLSAEKMGRAAEAGFKGHNEKTYFLKGSALLSESLHSTSSEVTKMVSAERATLHTEGIDPFSFEATHRYRWINEVVRSCCALTEPATKSKEFYTRLVTHRIWGSLIFVALMTIIFQSIFLWASVPMDAIDRLFSSISAWLTALLPAGPLRSLLVDGIVAGVGSVVVFVPQIAILFFFLGLLEDSGYLSRAAFLMDKVMRPVGLQGRSFIPLLSSFACAIPGIMSTRTIPSFADRMTTILIAPLMSCSARLPVYTLIIAAFIPHTLFFGIISLQGLVLLGMYLLGVVAAALIAWIFRRTLFKGEPAVFVMEMPPFRLPSYKVVVRDVVDRVVVFLKSAGTVILACSIVLWFLASYPGNSVKESFAGQIGSAIEPVIKPLGFNWEIGVGLLASFAAREVFVTSLATVYNLESTKDNTTSLIAVLKAKALSGEFPLVSAISLMVFFVFACQCTSTLAVCRRETGSWRWTAFMFFYMTFLAYVLSLLTYQIGIRI